MYQTVIIDDDQLARRGLRRILEQNFQEIEVIGEADSVANGLPLINECEPDLVFLDIQMPKKLCSLLPTLIMPSLPLNIQHSITL